MKKLIFKTLKLEETNILDRQQMRQIVGGYDGSPCKADASCTMGCQEWRGGEWHCSSCCLA